jgi:transposase InsO family protein
MLAEKAHFEVRAMCRVFGIAPSTYYGWECEQQCERAVRDEQLLTSVQRIFAEYRGRYGAPRVRRELLREGVGVGRKRVARLMREAGLRAKSRRKYKPTTDSNHSLPVAPNLIARDFHTERPDVAWVSDITYLWTRQGWLYLAVILDLYSRKVVGWRLSDRMTASLVCEALDDAARQRRPARGLVFHSDRGSQYASHAFRRRLQRRNMRQSMSRRGNCWDNAVAESFFATLKKELVRGRAFDTRDQARSEVFEYIEVFYNRRRTHSLLNYETPDAFEDCFEKKNAA